MIPPVPLVPLVLLVALVPYGSSGFPSPHGSLGSSGS